MILFVDSKFYDVNGNEVFIVSSDDLFNCFSNGKKYLKFEIENKIKNYNDTLTIRLFNKHELERIINSRINNK